MVRGTEGSITILSRQILSRNCFRNRVLILVSGRGCFNVDAVILLFTNLGRDGAV